MYKPERDSVSFGMRCFFVKCGLLICVLYFFESCRSEKLEIISVKAFSQFVEQTGYTTDAEKFDWSIIQHSISEYQVLGGVNWRCPDGNQYAQDHHPVTQVSYQDAFAYAQWANVSLPTYEEYWKLTAGDKRKINQGSTHVLPIEQVNIIGNTWELTMPDSYGRIRLAGGSYLCNQTTCNGTSPDRELFVDQITGNTHIGFAVIR